MNKIVGLRTLNMVFPKVREKTRASLLQQWGHFVVAILPSRVCLFLRRAEGGAKFYMLITFEWLAKLKVILTRILGFKYPHNLMWPFRWVAKIGFIFYYYFFNFFFHMAWPCKKQYGQFIVNNLQIVQTSDCILPNVKNIPIGRIWTTLCLFIRYYSVSYTLLHEIKKRKKKHA